MLRRAASRVSLRSRERKLRLFLELLRPGPETTVVDVGVTDAPFGGGSTDNFFEALYPWPDLVRDSTSYAGLGRSDAVAAAEKKVAGTLSFRSASRGEFGGEDAWIVSFEPAGGFGSGCVVAVRKSPNGTTATAAPGCRR